MKHITIGTVTLSVSEYAVGAAALLGIRNCGKTVTGKGICEQLLDNNVQPIIFDAVGKWRWLKVPADHSHGKGYSVVVAGGRHADLPLTPESVSEIVRAALRERIPLVIDLYDKNLSKSDWRKIVKQAIRIIHYENEGGAVHVFLEEAAEFVPQRVIDGETYAEVEKLVRMGGNNSVGITLINQRSQEVNKAVLDQCTTLVLGCQIGNKAIEAIGTWVERLDRATAESVEKSLPGLKAGEAWVWTRQSPDHPTKERIPMCRSFHPDRRTPEIVIKSAKPINTADFVSKLSDSIPKVIQQAKANDPELLKARIRELERQVKSTQPLPAKPVVQVKSALTNGDRKRLTSLVNTLNKIVECAKDAVLKSVQLAEVQRHFAPDIEFFKAKLLPMKIEARQVPSERAVTVRPAVPPRVTTQSNGKLGKCEMAILRVLAGYEHGCTIGKVALLAGYTMSGSFKNCLSALRTGGLIVGENNSVMQITAEGRAHGPFAELPTGAERINYWLNFPHFGKCERAILQALVSNPDGLDMEQLCRFTSYEASGSFKNSLSALRTAGVMTGRNNEVMSAKPILE
jgi:hypothetical protein